MALRKKERRIVIALAILVGLFPLGFLLHEFFPDWVWGIIFVPGFWICCEVMGANAEGIFRRPKNHEEQK